MTTIFGESLRFQPLPVVRDDRRYISLHARAIDGETLGDLLARMAGTVPDQPPFLVFRRSDIELCDKGAA